MTTPPLPPRPSVGRSSFAIAMKDYTFIRPGIAVSISAVTLVLALIIGVWLILSLRTAAATVERGAHTVATLHSYNAGVEVWREMGTSGDPAYQRPEAVALRDSIGRALRTHLAELAGTVTEEGEQELVRSVLSGLTSEATGPSSEARGAMIVLLARQDSAMFQAARTSQNAVLLSAALLAMAVIAAGMLVVPMAWLYTRHKRGATSDLGM